MKAWNLEDSALFGLGSDAFRICVTLLRLCSPGWMSDRPSVVAQLQSLTKRLWKHLWGRPHKAVSKAKPWCWQEKAKQPKDTPDIPCEVGCKWNNGLYFVNEKFEAQRTEVTCPRSHCYLRMLERVYGNKHSLWIHFFMNFLSLAHIYSRAWLGL